MTNVPFVISDWRRETAQEPILKVQNRFFEENPANFPNGSCLLLRPGMRKFMTIGAGLIYQMYVQDGIFNDDVFVFQNEEVNRISKNELTEQIVSVAEGWSTFSTDSNKGTFTSPIGQVAGYFFFSSGSTFWVYGETTFARNVLTNGAIIENNAVVQIGSMYYKFTDGDVNVGSPDGSVGNPWLVARETGLTTALANLFEAVNVSGSLNNYSAATSKNLQANGLTTTANSVTFVAVQGGSVGNDVLVSAASTAALSWSSPTNFSGGGLAVGNRAHRIYLPVDAGLPEAVGTINSYVIIATGAPLGNANPGTFYWIEPGDTFIDPLNFATAETSPDLIVSMRIVGNQIWFIGTGTIEVWRVTGDVNAPFTINQGYNFNFGGVPGTDLVIENSLVFIGSDGVIRAVTGTSSERISTNAIEEQVRKFRAKEFVSPIDNSFRAYSFTSDGHVFYVLSAGKDWTLVFDFTSKQWVRWLNFDETYLFQQTGANFFASKFPFLVGDINTNTLWWIDPDYKIDDYPEESLLVGLIPAVVSAGLPMTMRETLRCNELYLRGSVGDPTVSLFYLIDGNDGPYITDGDDTYLLDSDLVFESGDFTPSGVKLEISDDGGKTWWTAGIVDMELANYNQAPAWRSLGLIRAPGRLFKLSDYGALIRMDGLDVR